MAIIKALRAGQHKQPGVNATLCQMLPNCQVSETNQLEALTPLEDWT